MTESIRVIAYNADGMVESCEKAVPEGVLAKALPHVVAAKLIEDMMRRLPTVEHFAVDRIWNLSWMGDKPCNT